MTKKTNQLTPRSHCVRSTAQAVTTIHLVVKDDKRLALVIRRVRLFLCKLGFKYRFFKQPGCHSTRKLLKIARKTKIYLDDCKAIASIAVGNG